jgi:uncharacterized protein YlxW (UPF0749 family)
MGVFRFLSILVPYKIAKLDSMANCENDRIERMRRVLTLFVPQQNTIAMFQTAEQSLASSIEKTETELRNQVRNYPSVLPTELQNQLASMRVELDDVRKSRQNIMKMIYRTIRDTYNADAAVGAQIDHL